MEEDPKIDTVEKAVTEGVKKEVEENNTLKTVDTELKEEKMEVDAEIVKTEDEEKVYVKPLVLKTEPESEDLVKLVIEGIETGDDDNEEFIIMTPEEIQIFLEQKISEQVRNPQINPLLALQKRSQELLDEIRYKADEISKLGKAMDAMYRNQEKFLRHMDIFPKVPTNSVAVSVNLPLLMDSVPLRSTAKPPDEEAVIKKDLSDAKVMSPSVSRTKSATSVISNSTLTVPSAISITPIPNSSASTVSNTNSTALTAPKNNSTALSTSSTALSTSSTAPSTSSTAPSTSSTAPSTSSTAPAVPKAPISNLTTTVKSLPKLAPKSTGNIECIDLTDDTPIPVTKSVTNSSPLAAISLVKHPAPLPPKPFYPPNHLLPNVPPKPRLKISSEERGIVLQWDMPPCYSTATAYSKLKSFDIFGYQEQKNMVINTLLWKKIGAVKAMNLPMACTLTQFIEGQKYHFAIRAVDAYDRCGSYSDPISIVYKPNNAKKKLLNMT